MRLALQTVLVLAGCTLASTAWAAEVRNDEGVTKGDIEKAFKPQFSPYVGRNFPTRVFFGDTHLHTAVSVDAGTINRIGQEDAFRFARGEEITTTHGLRAKLSRPLDFLVISDHAEMYGLMPQLLSGDPEVLATPTGKKWYEELTERQQRSAYSPPRWRSSDHLSGDVPPIKSDKAVRNAWHAYTALADKYNEPGRFTALIGFEWTAIGGYNLHRNVIFRGDASIANRTIPYSQFDSKNPEDLWRHLAEFEKQTGAEVLAIPHNGNLSNGRMFTVETFDGTAAHRGNRRVARHVLRRSSKSPRSRATAKRTRCFRRTTSSPVTKNGTSPISTAPRPRSPKCCNGNTPAKPSRMVWCWSKKLGVNPYKFGMVGSTDSHTSMSTAEEDNFFGKHSGVEPEPHRWEHVVIDSPDPKFIDQGLATGRQRLRCRLGDREHARGDLRRHEAQGNLRDHGFPHDGPLLRRMGLQQGRHAVTPSGECRLRQGRADGRRPAGSSARRWQGPQFLGRGDEGSLQRQPRPHPDRQGLAGPRRQDA